MKPQDWQKPKGWLTKDRLQFLYHVGPQLVELLLKQQHFLPSKAVNLEFCRPCSLGVHWSSVEGRVGNPRKAHRGTSSYWPWLRMGGYPCPPGWWPEHWQLECHLKSCHLLGEQRREDTPLWPSRPLLPRGIQTPTCV